MRFFFPDSQDQIDPGFDFETEEKSEMRIRQRDDLYIHEVLGPDVIDGLLVSKAIVDGRVGASGKYTLAQRHRLYRVGIRRFFRLEKMPSDFRTMGDCGAFSYFDEDEPPYSVDEVIDFYDECQFDLGIAPDHIVFGFVADNNAPPEKLKEWKRRQELTISLAADFRSRCAEREVGFTPMAVAHGWSPQSYAESVAALQEAGYDRIALGGMVPLKTHEILSSLKRIADVRKRETQLHLLGIMREEAIVEFDALGVTSFDSTSAFRQSFKDDRDNYHTTGRSYTAIRVPQVEGNPKLKKVIEAGKVRQEDAVRLERECLAGLRKYDETGAGQSQLLGLLDEYAQLVGGLSAVGSTGKNRKGYAEAYSQTLEDAPWKKCDCKICREVGINVVIFRGSERNKRRGFHNIYAFRQRIDLELHVGSSS
jgi:hypothetical protein